MQINARGVQQMTSNVMRLRLWMGRATSRWAQGSECYSSPTKARTSDPGFLCERTSLGSIALLLEALLAKHWPATFLRRTRLKRHLAFCSTFRAHGIVHFLDTLTAGATLVAHKRKKPPHCWNGFTVA